MSTEQETLEHCLAWAVVKVQRLEDELAEVRRDLAESRETAARVIERNSVLERVNAERLEGAH